MYLQSFKSHRSSSPRSPSPPPDSSTEDSDVMVIRSPRNKSTPIITKKKAKVYASDVNRKVMKYLDEEFKAAKPSAKPSATVSVPPRDSVSTFIQDLETNIRSRVKPSLYDDLFHEINTTVLTYKKKHSAYIDVSLIPNYDPSLAVRSFQVPFKRTASASVDRISIETIPSNTQPQGLRRRRRQIAFLQDVSEDEEMKEEDDN